MIRLMFLVSVAALVFPAESFARHRPKFPYSAVVEGHDVYVRSGPGRNYYPTAKLKRGQQVTVHRHDPGGWYMIAPCTQSFSWIRARYVKPESRGRGVITTNNVVVRVGSNFGNDRDIEQVRLSKGTTVQILGEQTFQSTFGSIRMYKIAPPRGEYRWVSGRHIVPSDVTTRKINDRNPYSVPSQVTRKTDHSHEIGNPIEHSGPKFTGPKIGKPAGPPTFKHVSYDRERRSLDLLDEQFRAMVGRDTSEWDFGRLWARYRKLSKHSSNPVIAAKANRRLPQIAHYQSIQAEYAKMFQLTSAVQQRDAALAGQTAMARAQHFHRSPVVSSRVQQARPPVVLPQPQIPQRRFHNHQHAHRQFRTPVRRQIPPGYRPARQYRGPVHARRNARPFRSPVQANRLPQRRRFDGAGIVRKVEAHGTGMNYALFSPNGDLLAFMTPVRGLPMENYVDKEMGVFGKRTKRSDLGTDHIEVRAMMPVKLQP